LTMEESPWSRPDAFPHRVTPQPFQSVVCERFYVFVRTGPRRCRRVQKQNAFPANNTKTLQSSRSLHNIRGLVLLNRCQITNTRKSDSKPDSPAELAA
jgi:hypothetical protein